MHNILKKVLLTGMAIFIACFIGVFTSNTISAEYSADRTPINHIKSKDNQKILDRVPNQIIVKFKEDSLDIKNPLKINQIKSIEDKYLLSKKEEITNANIIVYDTNADLDETIGKLKKDTNIQYAEPNYLKTPTVINSNDTYRHYLWGLDNIGQNVNGTIGTNDADIDAPEAWLTSEGSTNVIVAVIDTGVAYNHPDLINNMWNGTNCLDENNIIWGVANTDLISRKMIKSLFLQVQITEHTLPV